MTDNIKIYHNPRCSKSRATLALLNDQGLQPQIIEYLQTPPTAEELSRILDLLGLEPHQLIRSGEVEYKENNLHKLKPEREQLIAIMVKYPKLIERPIVIANGKAAIGRPPETILSILK